MFQKLKFKGALILGSIALTQACDSTSPSSPGLSQSLGGDKLSETFQSITGECVLENYSIAGASSDNDYDSNYNPSLAIDSNLGTESRWSSKGDSQSIVLELGELRTITAIRTAWYKGDVREAYFDVNTSPDNNNWTNVLSDAVAEGSEDFITFNLAESNARYVQIIARGNSQSQWNSLIEVEVLGCDTPLTPEVPEEEPEDVPEDVPEDAPDVPDVPGECTVESDIAISSATSTGSYDDNYSPSLAIDNNLDSQSRWSADGIGRDITFDLGQVNTVKSISTAWYKANEREAYFDVETSTNNSNWTTVLSQATATGTEGFINFDILESQARYVRVVGQGNSNSNWNSLIEINIHRCAGDIPEDDTPEDDIPEDDTPEDDNPEDDNPEDDTPEDDNPEGDNPEDDNPEDDNPEDSPGTPLTPTVLNTVPEINCTIEVSSESQLEDNTGYSMNAGTTVCLLDGTYRNVEFEIGGNGSANRPITVAAKNPGSVFIEGDSQVRMSGDHVVLQGLIFRNGNSADGDLIQTRGGSSAPCDNCRITEVTVTDWDKEFEDSNKWLLIYGQNNRVDHSWFSGKTTRGALMIVDRGEITDPDYAQIDHNYFGDRLPFDGGEFPGEFDNEFEGIRIGTSDTQAYPSYSRVEYNYMERIRGEAEIISNKSGSNVISNNTIRSSYGAIVNRHGSGSTFSNNFIFADGYGMSGGIRIAGADHQVTNNYIEGCTFTGNTYHGGIVLTKTTGSQATSGYQQVDNVLIAHNTLVNCADSIRLEGGADSSSTLPRNVSLINNVVTDAVGSIFYGDIPPSTTFAGNYFGGDSLGLDSAPEGVIFGDPSFNRSSDNLYRPSSNSSVIGGGVSNYGSFPAVTIDMDGQRRVNPDSGADEVSSADKTLRPLTASDVGPLNYRP